MMTNDDVLQKISRRGALGFIRRGRFRPPIAPICPAKTTKDYI
jgi:hypothetical protein